MCFIIFPEPRVNHFCYNKRRVKVETNLTSVFSFLIIKITISSIVIDLKKLLFSTNSLAMLLSDSLLSIVCYRTVQ